MRLAVQVVKNRLGFFLCCMSINISFLPIKKEQKSRKSAKAASDEFSYGHIQWHSQETEAYYIIRPCYS